MIIMIKVIHVDVEHIPNETCRTTPSDPQGRFPKVTIQISTPSAIPGAYEYLIGKTCACGEGHITYGTWRLPPEGMLFQDVEALLRYLNKDDAYAVGHGVMERPPLVERGMW